MSSAIRLGLLAAAWLAAAAGTHAQPASPADAASAADPLQPGAAVPPLVYTSPLARYRAAREVEVVSWREANDTVARIGGWRAYAREAGQPEAPVPAPVHAPAPAPAPAPAVPSTPTAPSHGKH